MSAPLLDQELTFSGNASDANVTALIPTSLRGQFVEFTIYIEFSSGSAAGKVQLETSWQDPGHQALQYAGTWAAVGATIDWAAASSQKYVSVTGVFGTLRLRIDTAVTTGTVKAYIVAAAGKN
jgi:hypothetical protein